MSILIVDDSMVSQTFMSDLLIEVGYTDQILCNSVEDAYQAIGFNDPGKTETDLDLVLLDINLPGMDGFEILKLLKKCKTCCNTPVIAISANAMTKNIEKGLAAGFDDYITKPIDVVAFLHAVDTVLLTLKKP